MKGILFKPWKHQFIREHLDMEMQTRRLSGLKEINQEPNNWSHVEWKYRLTDGFAKGFLFERSDGIQKVIRPRYQVGEIAFIKEAWATEKRLDHLTISELGHAAEMPIFYKLDNPRTLLEIGKWHSPLFMPEWAARDFIKILAIRYERLQKITPEDCIAEGISVPYQSAYESLATDYRSPTELIKSYQVLWDSINPAFPWNSNPWNVVNTFKKVEKPK